MTLTHSDVASLTSALACWEVAEYCFGLLVAVACLGEYAADFTDWFTHGMEEKKKRLAKISTLLLISALALELICLVKTNQLSGQLVGSLASKADEASTKSQSAITDAASASTLAKGAKDDAKTAKDDAISAKGRLLESRQ